MIQLSNALPIQFWAIDQQTYNEKVVCGISPVCFCQPVECDQEIPIPFTETIAREYKLKITGGDGSELALIPFALLNLVSPFQYFLSFKPSDYDICNDQIKLSIVYIIPDPDPNQLHFYEPAEEVPIHFHEPVEVTPVYFYEP